MDAKFAVFLIGLLSFQGCIGREEPRCSKYDFEEKVLEKVIRFEHKMEIMTSSINEISRKANEDIRDIKTELETRGAEHTDAFKKLSDGLKTQLTELNDTIQLERAVMAEREKVLNDTIQKTLEDLTAKIQTSSYAFSAHAISDTTPTTDDTLVFTQTFINEEGAYSTTTGKYTAPCDGIYEFHATLALYGSTKKYIYVEFIAGGISIGKFAVGDDFFDPSSSGSALARIEKDTEVYLRVTTYTSGVRLRDNTYRMNSFSGHLIGK